MFRRRRSREHGQSMVETALMLPVLFAILIGIIETARLISAFLILQQGAWEGGRIAATGATTAQIETRVTEALSGLLDPLPTLEIDPASDADRVSGVKATVKLSYSLDLVSPSIAKITPDTRSLEAQVVVRIE